MYMIFTFQRVVRATPSHKLFMELESFVFYLLSFVFCLWLLAQIVLSGPLFNEQSLDVGEPP